MTPETIKERLDDIDSEKALLYAELSRINREETMLLKLYNKIGDTDVGKGNTHPVTRDDR